ncbi:MAG: PP2C family protein-serine/threonine phosphatase [Thermoanaerobaculia bacterium]
MHRSTVELFSLPAAGPKHAFRAAELLLDDLTFRNELADLREAVVRICDGLRSDESPGAAIYLRDGFFFRRLDEVRFPGAPAALAPDQTEQLRHDASAYGFDGRGAATWNVGGRREWVVSWQFSRAFSNDEVVALEAVRLALNQKLLESSFTGILQQAAAIQRSLLPDPLPTIPGFDLAARSVPAESVGGDAYDALGLGPETVAFAVADASGHGLPAALEARDVVVGLRMGAARHMKIGATVEKLNGILCRSTLSSRFVSLVYGELESDGRFQFVNAGHPHPILVNPAATTVFLETGIVLGVEPGVRHRIQHGEIAPGGLLAVVTDGILECESPNGEQFGPGRVASLVRALADRPAAWIVSALFEALEDHSREKSLADDATVLVIRRE